MVRTYKLYAVVTATGAALAQFQIIANGVIRGIQLNSQPGGAVGAAADFVQPEISLNPAQQVATNNAQGTLAQLTVSALSGIGTTYVPTAVRVRAGDNVYLHAVESGTTSWPTVAVVHIDESGSGK